MDASKPPSAGKSQISDVDRLRLLAIAQQSGAATPAMKNYVAWTVSSLSVEITKSRAGEETARLQGKLQLAYELSDILCGGGQTPSQTKL